MDEYTEDYRNRFIDGVAGVITAIFQKLNIQKVDNDYFHMIIYTLNSVPKVQNLFELYKKVEENLLFEVYNLT